MHNAIRVAGLVAIMFASASAQDRSVDQPGKELVLSGSVFGGYDSDITGVTTDPDAQPSAGSAGALVSLRFRQRSDRLAFFTRGYADARNYYTDRPVRATSVGGSAQLRTEVTPRLRLDGWVASDYSPRFLFSVLPDVVDFPSEAAPPSLDYGIVRNESINNRAGAAASLRVTRRSSLYATYAGGYFKYLHQNYVMNSHNYGAGYTFNVARYTSLRLGYAEHQINYPSLLGSTARTIRNRTIDAGIHYSRPLSVSRRTTLGFGTGSTAIDDGIETFYTATGRASLRHEMGRTWSTNVAYARGISVVGGFDEPFFADAVTLDLRGEPSRRAHMIAVAGFANGNLGLGSRAQDYRSFQASTRFEFALTRRFGLFGSYFFYGYTLEEGARRPAGLPSQVDRHGVRGGLMVRLPLMEERTSRAPW